MESAFGIDHGYDEVAKAGPGLIRPLGREIGMAARRGASSVGRAAGKNINKPGIQGAVGRGQVSVGRGLKRISNTAMNRPGLAGGAAVGGVAAAGVGAGAVGGSMMNRNQKLSQYR